jgi:hypothetical protein
VGGDGLRPAALGPEEPEQGGAAMKPHIGPAEPVPTEALPHLWSQDEAAKAMRVSVRYLRESTCPRVELPGNGDEGRPMLRYDPEVCRAWWRKHLNREESAA